jgi:hypothetical protein
MEQQLRSRRSARRVARCAQFRGDDAATAEEQRTLIDALPLLGRLAQS